MIKQVKIRLSCFDGHFDVSDYHRQRHMSWIESIQINNSCLTNLMSLWQTKILPRTFILFIGIQDCICRRRKNQENRTTNMSSFLCFLFLFPLILILLKSFKPSNKWNLPPGPLKLTIIGNLHQRRELHPRNRRNLTQKYGPVVLLRFGSVPVVVISSRDAAEEVLKVHDLECCSRPETVGTRTISYNCKGIGFMPYGEEWKAMRKLAVVELFSIKKTTVF